MKIGGIAPRSITLEVSGQLRALEALPPAPIGWEAGWAPEPVWMQCREKEESLL